MDVQPAQSESGLDLEISSKNFAFEDNFDVDVSLDWWGKYWAIYCVPIIILYVTVVLAGRFYMASRIPYSLRGLLMVWNVALAAFSIFGAYRDCPNQLKIVYRNGLYDSICSDKYFNNKHRIVWASIFCLSKAPELVDTLFIVLRKQKLIFLHYYHHAAVLAYSIFMYSDRAQVARWFSFMNFAVHSLMYSYYAVRSAGFKLPKPVAMSVTFAQIFQMVLGTFFVSYALVMKITDVPCSVSLNGLVFGLIMYLSFGVLFVNFFVQSYLKPRHQKFDKSK